MVKSEMKSKGKIISNILFGIFMLIVFLIGTNIITAKVKGQNPNVFGVYFYRVTTDSMYPVLPRKTIIISKKVKDYKELKAGVDGDIVTFYDDNNARITHRIVEKVYNDKNELIGFKTKGDSPYNSIDPNVLYFDKIEAVFCFKFF